MLIFHLEKPLLQKDFDNAIENTKKKLSYSFAKNIKHGFIVFMVLAFLIYSMGFNFDSTDRGALKFLLYLLLALISSTLLIMPFILKSARIYQLYFTPYSTAALEKLHNCKAYINMPGMEKYKQYAEDVCKQNRELTNFECDEITKYWNSIKNH